MTTDSTERQRREQAEKQLRNLTEAHIIQKKIDDDKLLSALAAIEKLNGFRNVMANAFNQFGATKDYADAKPACGMFWKADNDFDRVVSDVDLSLLHEHDAETYAKGAQHQHKEDELVRKSLVEALEKFMAAASLLEGQQIEYPTAIKLSEAVNYAADALTKAKEGK